MIRHVWTVICSKSSVDETTKNISLLDVIEQVTVDEESAKKEQLLPLRFEIVTLWAHDEPNKPKPTEARLRLVTPEGKEISRQAYGVDLSEHPRMRTRIRVPGLPFSGVGVYYFHIDLRRQDGKTWDEVASLPLQVLVEST